MHEYYERMRQDGIVLYFNGPISHGIVEGIGEMMRHKLASETTDAALVRRLFAILIEQMQNVVKYSASRGACVPDGETAQGQIIVGREDDWFYVACGNPVRQAQQERIRAGIEAVRHMGKEELRAYYSARRRLDPDAESRGAGLGFIEMARRASRPLDYEFTPIDDGTAFFSVKVFV